MLSNAQDGLAQQRQPAYRLNQVTVELWTAQNNLYSAVAGTEIGDRIRVPNSYAAVAPTSQVDLIAEGWTDTIGVGVYAVTLDTSPRTKPRMVWDHTSYGRLQCDGQTLNASITNSASSLAIATTAGKSTFTTSAGAYPLTIQLGAGTDHLTSAPGGATSPQSFTGVTRGVNGMTAAAQSSGASAAIV